MAIFDPRKGRLAYSNVRSNSANASRTTFRGNQPTQFANW